MSDLHLTPTETQHLRDVARAILLDRMSVNSAVLVEALTPVINSIITQRHQATLDAISETTLSLAPTLPLLRRQLDDFDERAHSWSMAADSWEDLGDSARADICRATARSNRDAADTLHDLLDALTPLIPDPDPDPESTRPE